MIPTKTDKCFYLASFEMSHCPILTFFLSRLQKRQSDGWQSSLPSLLTVTNKQVCIHILQLGVKKRAMMLQTIVTNETSVHEKTKGFKLSPNIFFHVSILKLLFLIWSLNAVTAFGASMSAHTGIKKRLYSRLSLLWSFIYCTLCESNKRIIFLQFSLLCHLPVASSFFFLLATSPFTFINPIWFRLSVLKSIDLVSYLWD